MTVRYKGAQLVELPEYQFRQDDGFHFHRRLRGVPGDVIGAANYYKSQGYDTAVYHDGPYSDLRVFNTSRLSTPSVQYTQLWSIRSEIIEKSLFSEPRAIEEAGRFTGTVQLQDGDVLLGDVERGGRAGYKKKIEKARDEKSGLNTQLFPTTPVTGFPYAHKIYAELMRGGGAYEHDYTILTRTLNFEHRLPPVNLDLVSNRYIYSTSQINALYSPPAGVKFNLPAPIAFGSTDHPHQAKWGWRIREQSAEITNGTTGQHRQTWVYAAWSTFLYSVYDEATW